MDFLARAGEALLMALGMFWKTGWSLVLGFLISGVLQAVVSKERMRSALGRDGAKEVALATALGAASSSCSYAAAAISRTIFKKGAALVPSLAFQFASTNLVIELGLVLLILMGWQFMAAEWIGGVVLVIIMTLLVRLTYPAKLVEEARRYPEVGGGHRHEEHASSSSTFWQKLRQPATRVAIAQNFVMDWRMLWKDLALGFLIAGALSAFVPDHVWHRLFLLDAPAWLQVPVNAVIGPLVAVITFVCSIGNVPMAAVLWGSGVSFGGVLAFIYADLIVLPLLDIYRRYYGWKMAAYIAGIFFATMVLAAIVMDAAFSGLGLIPARDANMRAEMMTFAIDYTFWLNIAFGALALWLFRVAARSPMAVAPCEHHAPKAQAASKHCCHD
ncbi:MAG: permease [Rhodomicrobium sp.]|nr:permease [Rhodomicrobium sp.]